MWAQVPKITARLCRNEISLPPCPLLQYVPFNGTAFHSLLVDGMLGHKLVCTHDLNDVVEMVLACNQLALLPGKPMFGCLSPWGGRWEHMNPAHVQIVDCVTKNYGIDAPDASATASKETGYPCISVPFLYNYKHKKVNV